MSDNEPDAHKISLYDLGVIISIAKQKFATEAFPIEVSNREVDDSELRHLFVVEAFIMYANGKGLLNKPVNFDRTKRRTK